MRVANRRGAGSAGSDLRRSRPARVGRPATSGLPVILAALLAALAALLFAAAPAAAADSCPNAAIRAQQGPAVEALPDCMALEMVSVPKTFMQAADRATVSADGQRVLYFSRAALNDPPSITSPLMPDVYVATRTEDGWITQATTPPIVPEGGLARPWGSMLIARSFDPSLSRWITIASTMDQHARGQARVFRGALGGIFEPLSPLLVPAHGVPDAGGLPHDGLLASRVVDYGLFYTASADHSRVYFRPAQSVGYFAEDPSPTANTDGNAYVAARGSDGSTTLELLARDADGKVWGGRCGARVGGAAPTWNGVVHYGREQGAVSPDGSRVYFTTRPAQTGDAACDTFSNNLRIMRRIETPAGPWISELIANECKRQDPPCAQIAGDDLYQGASVDGTKVYFATNRQLADTDLDGEGFGSTCVPLFLGPVGCDLYMYDSTQPTGHRLVQVSAGEATASHPTPGANAGVRDGTVAISGDGSHAYFVADGVLTEDPNPAGDTPQPNQRNLYVWHAESEQLEFVGTLAASDTNLWGSWGTFKNHAYPVPATGRDESGQEIGGDGSVLVFITRASLTDDDTDGGRRDVYRYDADAGTLELISKAAPGGEDGGPHDVAQRAPINGSYSGTEYAEFGRWVGEDGRTIVFQTSEDLTGDAPEGLYSDYMWRDGELYRLPGTERREADLSDTTQLWKAPALSHDGNTVAFDPAAPLLPEDGDVARDVYVARVNGGFEPKRDPAVCDVLADGCQAHGGSSLAGDAATDRAVPDENSHGDARTILRIAPLTSRARRRAARTGVLPVRVSVNGATRLTVVARGRVGGRVKRVAAKRVAVRRAGPSVIRIRLGRSVQDRLRRGGAVRLAVRVSASDGAAAGARVVLRRAGR